MDTTNGIVTQRDGHLTCARVFRMASYLDNGTQLAFFISYRKCRNAASLDAHSASASPAVTLEYRDPWVVLSLRKVPAVVWYQILPWTS
jgi:hypothetical protein